MPVATKPSADLPAVGELAEHHVILSSMVLALEEKLKQLNHLVMITGVNLNKLKEEHEEELRSQKYKLSVQKDEHTTSLEQEKYALTQRQKELDEVASNLEHERKDLAVLQAQAASIQTQHDTNVAERIEMEQQRVLLGETTQQVEQLQSKYAQLMTELLERESVVKRQENEQTSRGQELESLSTSSTAAQEQAELHLKNLSALREELDPKLAALAKQEAEVKEALVRSESLHAEAFQKAAENDQKYADLTGLAQRLTAREKGLTDHATTLRQLEQELTIKVQQAKAKGVDVGEVPKLP